jgi:hypothetical protein
MTTLMSFDLYFHSELKIKFLSFNTDVYEVTDVYKDLLIIYL